MRPLQYTMVTPPTVRGESFSAMPVLLSAASAYAGCCRFSSRRRGDGGAGLDVVWPEFAAVAAIGGVFFGLALLRFRRVAAAEAGAARRLYSALDWRKLRREERAAWRRPLPLFPMLFSHQERTIRTVPSIPPATTF